MNIFDMIYIHNEVVTFLVIEFASAKRRRGGLVWRWLRQRAGTDSGNCVVNVGDAHLHSTFCFYVYASKLEVCEQQT